MRSIARVDLPGVDRWLPRGLATLAALLVCWPVLGPGYTLSYDMVFVPDPALSAHSWGGDDSVPRAVPGDAVIALLATVVPVPVIQQTALVGIVALSVLGGWRMSPARTLPGAAASALAFGWTPYVGERLLMGHWSLLVGYALLPWVVVVAQRARATGRAHVAPFVVLASIATAAAPTAAVLVSALVVAMTLGRPWTWRPRLLLWLGLAVLAATWTVPGILARARLVDDPVGVQSFAPSADTPLGVVPSLMTGGGVWNILAHLDTRGGLPIAVVGLALVGVSMWGWMSMGRTHGGALPVLLLGIGGLAIAVVATTSVGQDALVWATGHIPGAGLLRDAQKWTAWWILAVAFGLPVGAEQLLVRRVPRHWFAPSLTVVAALPVLLAPDVAWGVGGQLHRAGWPDQFPQVARQLNAQTDRGAVLVLPWHAFRAWEWNDQRAVLDPWQRLLDRPVVWRDDLEVGDRVVPGEDPTAGRVSAMVEAGPLQAEALRALGITWVITDLRTAGDEPPAVVGDTEIVTPGPDLRVTHLTGPDLRGAPANRTVLVVQLLALLVAVGAAARTLALASQELRTSPHRGATLPAESSDGREPHV